MTMKIRTQLFLGFGALLSLMVGVATVAKLEVDSIDSSLTEITDVNAVKQRQAINFRGSVHDRAIAFRDLVLLKDTRELEDTILEIQRLTTIYNEAARELDRIFGEIESDDLEERELLRSIKVIEQKAIPILDTILIEYRVGNLATVTAIINKDARPVFSEWLAAINRFIDWQEHKSQRETESTRALTANFTTVISVFCFLGILVGSMVAYMIIRRLYRSLGGEPADVAKVVHRIAKGDLSEAIQAGSPESISAAIAEMQSKLREMVAEIATASTNIASQTTQLGEASRSVLRSAEEQASLTSASAMSLEEMVHSIRKVSEITQHTEENSERAAELSAGGVELVRLVASEMADVSRTLANSSEQVNSLQRRSEEISGIVGAIRSIADQTNLLALNAAIEAARAGENGRGFAVVADEVRQLAQRTTEATGEVAEMIVQIQSETREAVSTMQTAGPLVERGLELANQAAERLDQIRVQSNGSLINVRDIVQVSEQQVEAIAAISRHVERISVMSQDTSEATHGNAKATETLDRTTKMLEREILRFRLS